MPIVIPGTVTPVTIDTTPTANAITISSNVETSYTVSGTFSSAPATTPPTVGGLPRVAVFNAPGTLSTPSSVTRIKVTVVAGAPGVPGSGGTSTGGGSGGSGGVSSVGSYITQSTCGISATCPTSTAVIARDLPGDRGIAKSTPFSNTGATYNSTVKSKVTVAYINGPFPPTIPITVGAGGGGGGGGGGVGSPGGNASLANGGNGGNAGNATAGSGGGGAGASGGTIGAGGTAGSNTSICYVGTNGPPGSPNQLVAGGAGRSGLYNPNPVFHPAVCVPNPPGPCCTPTPPTYYPCYYTCCGSPSGDGGAGGGSGFSGVVIVEYH